MVRSFPNRPNLDQLKNQAKDLLKQHRDGDFEVTGVLRRLPRFASAAAPDILAATVTLADVHQAMAMEHGFGSWAQLKRFVEGVAPKATPQLKRQNGATWIEGIARLSWGAGRDCTFIGALEAALSATDAPWHYADLMSFSGLALRFRWSPTVCPSCAVGELPDEAAAVLRCTGWNLPTDVQFGQENPDRQPVKERIVRSIDAGLPVLAYGHCLDMAVIYGYEDGGNVLWFTDYHKPREMPFKLALDKLGPLQSYLERRADAPPPERQMRLAIDLAVQHWSRGTHDGGLPGREYWYGSRAYEGWCDALARVHGLPGEQANRLHYTHCFARMQLADARRAAAQFLDERIDGLGESASLHLRAAAEHAGACANRLYRAADAEGLFKGPQQGMTLEAWTPEVRAREAAVLQDAAEFDALTVSALDKALAAARKS